MFWLDLFVSIGLISCCISLVCIVINVLCCCNTPKIIEKIGNVAKSADLKVKEIKL